MKYLKVESKISNTDFINARGKHIDDIDSKKAIMLMRYGVPCCVIVSLEEYKKDYKADNLPVVKLEDLQKALAKVRPAQKTEFQISNHKIKVAVLLSISSAKEKYDEITFTENLV